MNVRAMMLGAVAVVATGCWNSTMQRAETLGQGNFEIAIEPGVVGVAGTSVDDVGVGGGFLPSFNLAARFGVSDRVDLGARLGSGFAEFQMKFMLTDPSADTKISLAPYVTPAVFGGGGAAAGFLRAKVPLLIGFAAGANNQVVLGPSIGTWAFLAGGGGAAAGGAAIYPGMSIGYSAQVGDSVRLHPEIGVDIPLVGVGGGGGFVDGAVGFGGVLYTVALGVQFGNGYSK